jgi:predicted 3-demethylubiquinone-9 3-methyltransferase (glyoxalase superfamily)
MPKLLTEKAKPTKVYRSHIEWLKDKHGIDWRPEVKDAPTGPTKGEDARRSHNPQHQ